MVSNFEFKLRNDLFIPEHRKQVFIGTSKKNLKSCKTFVELSGFVVDEIELPIQLLQWKTDDVCRWIKNLGFPQYQNTFFVNLINGRTLIKIDALALVKMNIKDFEHIKIITSEIRRTYKIDLDNFSRSISLPTKHPGDLFKFHKTSTGPIYEICSQTDFFKKMKFMEEAKVQLNHFEQLHKWLKHVSDFQNIRIGDIKRVNLFFVKPNPHRELEKFEEPSKCHCTFPPCDCNWSDKEKRLPWRLNFLVEIDEGKYFENLCAGRAGETNFILITE